MSNKTKKIIKLYEDSLDDWAFSRTEKRNIQQEIIKANLDSDDIGYLRRKIFKLAQQKIANGNASSLFDWAERATQALMNSIMPNQVINNEAYFSPGNECKATILRLITGAKHQMKICVFTITDNDISNALVKSHDNGIKIKIITDNDKSMDLGSDIERLARLRVEVKTDNTNYHMHHKFAVFDNKILLTGSYNWTRSATLYNQENLLTTSDTKLVNEYSHEFENLWPKMTDYYG